MCCFTWMPLTIGRILARKPSIVSVFSERHFGQVFRRKAVKIGFNGGNFLLS